MSYNVREVRSHFPSLESGAVFFDNPGGTQVPQQVIDAVQNYYCDANSNTHGAFATSRRSDEIIASSRVALADLLNADSPDEIIFGPNMTTLTFHLSRAIGRELASGDEIIVTHLDHDANIAPWLALEERGAVIRWVDINPADCTLDLTQFEKQLSRRTRLVAVGGASNAVGTINDLRSIIAQAHMIGALVYVDAVHLAPHAPIDVQALDCDFLACSVYKFYGPHIGVLYGKYDLLDRLPAYKVRPSPKLPPDKFETGTGNHEGMAGARAAVEYLAALGEKYGAQYADRAGAYEGRRRQLKTALAAIQEYERELFVQMMRGLSAIPGITIYGVTDETRFDARTPTVAFRHPNVGPRELAEKLGEQDIFTWDGNYYAFALMERLGLESHGGAVRVGLAHYNTAEEVERFLQVLRNVIGR